MALCRILNVNCVIWEIQQQYAEVIFRHQVQNPLSTRTVHLRYASRRHYESTDIPKVYLPFIVRYIPTLYLIFVSFRISLLLMYLLTTINTALVNDVREPNLINKYYLPLDFTAYYSCI